MFAYQQSVRRLELFMLDVNTEVHSLKYMRNYAYLLDTLKEHGTG